MAVCIDLPTNRQDKVKLADWMEINALLDKDKSSSLEDIVSILKEESVLEETLEALRTDVASELVARMKKIGEAYPFIFSGMTLDIKKGGYKNKWAYLFCLLISYVGVDFGERKLKIWDSKKIAEMFEIISGLAAENFLCGKSLSAELLYFGHPRNSWKKSERPFKVALPILRSKIDEGTIENLPTARHQKDAGLDIVTWRNFPDKKAAKLLFFAQCAAGKDFKAKRHEISKFFNFLSVRGSYLKGLFIPHELDEDLWREFSHDPVVGILFDRSRIAFFATSWSGDGFKIILPKTMKALRKYKVAI